MPSKIKEKLPKTDEINKTTYLKQEAYWQITFQVFIKQIIYPSYSTTCFMISSVNNLNEHFNVTKSLKLGICNQPHCKFHYFY